MRDESVMQQAIVLGMGSGRCGTLSLAQVLSRQPGVMFSHEAPPLLPWQREPGSNVIRERFARWRRTRQAAIVGDVASFYLPYVEDALALDAAREQVMQVATTRVPDAKRAGNLAKRFRENGEAYFRFITTPGIDPTNNLAEQAIRFVVIDRHITQGTRSEKGRRWCERIWTVIATCAQQGRAVFQFLLDSVQAHLCGVPPPLVIAVKPLTAFS